MTRLFSNLFAGCNRWKCEHDYSEFNRSCTSYDKLSQYVEIISPDNWLNLTENDYDKLHTVDKKLFESN